MNIILVGMPGCGKSTVSAVLAEKTGFVAVDTDELITREYGAITNIFSERGEKFFRDIERGQIARLSRSSGLIIATGGGALTIPENVENLTLSGKIVYLKTSVSELYARIGEDKTRPLLLGDALANLNDLYSRRAHIYEKCADIVVSTDGRTPEQISNIIAERIGL